jgi:pimeloyl-ACP methyl ester carboxylesterase
MREGAVTVRDGRTVAYGEFGDPNGATVLMCHGSAESRLFEVDPAWTATTGVRVITPDRPGFGRSDPQPGRTLAGWAEDAEDLVDALGIGDFAVLGWSGGGPHALATAYGLGPRVRKVAIVGSTGPVHLVPAAYDMLTPPLRALADMPRDDPRAIAEIVLAVAQEWVDDPEAFTLGGDPQPDDAAIEAHAEWGPNLVAQIREGLRRADGIAWDSAALHCEWGFAVDDVTQPCDLWHGTDDRVCPFAYAEWYAKTLPEATLHAIPGGHFIAYSSWRDIVAHLLT